MYPHHTLLPESLRRELVTQLRPQGAPRYDYNGIGIYSAAFIMCLAKRAGLMDVEDLGAFINHEELPPQLATAILSSVGPEWQRYRRLFSIASEEELAEFILEAGADEWNRGRSSNSLVRLALKILGLESDNYHGSFACFGLAAPSGLVAAVRMRNRDYDLSPSFWGFRGIDINPEIAAIAMMQMRLLGDRQPSETIRCNNLFGSDSIGKFDHVFCRAPWGMVLRPFWQDIESFIRSEYPVLSNIRPTISSEWAFALKAMASLEQGGRTVVVMSSKPLWSDRDAAIRRYVLQGGGVEAVVALPARTLPQTGLQPHLVVLRRPGQIAPPCQSVVFIDAGREEMPARARATLSESDIDSILTAIHARDIVLASSGIKVTVRPVEELARGNAMLVPRNVFREKDKVEHGEPLEKLVRDIRRGYPFLSREQDKLLTHTPTSFRYLTMKDIQDGRIDENLDYLTEITPRMEGACGKKGDLIVSKIGQTIKTAVLQPKDGETVLVSNNLFSITLDTEKIDPYYLQAYLESDSGKEALKSISDGSVVIHLTRHDLLKLVVPCPPLDKQRKLAMAFKENLDNIAVLKRELNRALYAVGSLFSKFQKEE